MKRALAAAAALLALAGCARSEPRLADPKTNNLDRALTLRVSGARTFSYDGRATMTFVAREAQGAQARFSAAALNPLETLKGNGFEVRPDVGLLGVYTGSGDYVVPAGVSRPVPTAGPTLAPPTGPERDSNIAVTFSEPSKPAVRFSYLLEPCSLKLDKDATEGSLRCPKLAAIDGSTVSVEMTWGP